MSFGDYFPEGFKKSFASTLIAPGSVFKYFQTNTKPPKEKYFVVVSNANGEMVFCCVYINTNINPNKFHNTKLVALNLPITKVKNPFLKYDCYVDCSQLFEKTHEEVISKFKLDHSCHIGHLHEDDFNYLYETIKTAHTIEKYILKKFNIL